MGWKEYERVRQVSKSVITASFTRKENHGQGASEAMASDGLWIIRALVPLVMKAIALVSGHY